MTDIQRVAMLSVHTCPLAMLGGKETGGMNVYVRELTTELDRRGIAVDVFTRSQEPGTPVVHGILGERSRVIHVPAGPEVPYDKNRVYEHLPEFIDAKMGFNPWICCFMNCGHLKFSSNFTCNRRPKTLDYSHAELALLTC